MSQCRLYHGQEPAPHQAPTAPTSATHSFSHLPAKRGSNATNHRQQQPSQLLDLFCGSEAKPSGPSGMPGRDLDPLATEAGRTWTGPATRSHSRIDQTDTCDASRVFRKQVPTFSNERHVDRAVLLRLQRLKGLQVDSRQEARLAAKREAVVRKTRTALSVLLDGSHDSHAARRAALPSAADAGTGGGFVYVAVFDRVLFAGSHITSYAVFPRPTQVRSC